MAGFLLTTQAIVNANLLTDSEGASVQVAGVSGGVTFAGNGLLVTQSGVNWKILTENGNAIDCYAQGSVPTFAGKFFLACTQPFAGGLLSLANGVIRVIPVSAPAP